MHSRFQEAWRAFLGTILTGKASKSPLPAWTEAIDEEVGIKREDLSNTQPFHQGEVGAVHEAERLIRKGLGDMPGGLEIYWLCSQDGGSCFSQGFPEGEGSRPAQVSVKEGPRLRDDEVGGDEGCLPRMFSVEAGCVSVMPVRSVGDSVPGPGVNEYAHVGGPRQDIYRGVQKCPDGHSSLAQRS